MSALPNIESEPAYPLGSQPIHEAEATLGTITLRALGAPIMEEAFDIEIKAAPPFSQEMADLRAQLAAANERTEVEKRVSAALRNELWETRVREKATNDRVNLLLDELTQARETKGIVFNELTKVRSELRLTRANLADALDMLAAERAASLGHEYRSKIDELTALGNRLDLKERFNAHTRWSFGFLTDIDYFKEVNDQLGHAVGDKVLKATGLEVSHSVRDEDTDIATRLGGDEIMGVIAIPTPNRHRKAERGITTEELVDQLEADIPARIAENFRRGLRKVYRELRQDPDFTDDPARLPLVASVFSKLGISVGTVRYEPGMSFDELYRRADRKMYEIKEMRHAADSTAVTEDPKTGRAS